MNDRKIISVKINSELSLDLNYCTFDDIIAEFDSIRNDPENAIYTKFWVQFEEGPWDDTKYPYAYGERLETDEEYEARMAKNKVVADRQEAKERAEYERLAKKFGKSE